MEKKEYFERIKIGLTQPFPVVADSVKISQKYIAYPRGRRLDIDVSLCKGSFANGKYSTLMVIACNQDLYGGAFNAGFNPEIGARKESVWDFCKENGLRICEVVNSFPFEKVIVEKI